MTSVAARNPTEWRTQIRQFTGAFCDVIAERGLRAAAGDVAAECRLFSSLLRLVDGVVAPPAPLTLPACRYMERAIETAPREGKADVEFLDSCAALVPWLHWRNKYPPTAANERLRDGFAFCDVVGPDGSQESEDVTLGFVLLAPGLCYPFHKHPAVELYYLVSGPSEWAVDFATPSPRTPGELIVHKSGQPHAMRAGESPMLAVSAWRGDIRSPSTIDSAAALRVGDA